MSGAPAEIATDEPARRIAHRRGIFPDPIAHPEAKDADSEDEFCQGIHLVIAVSIPLYKNSAVA